MTAPLQQRDIVPTIERGTTWGTAIGSTPLGLAAELMEIVIEPTNHDKNSSRGVRGMSEEDNWNDFSASVPTASVETPVTITNLEAYLLGMFQKSVDWSGVAGTGSAEVWTIEPVQEPNLPKISDDEGYFFTLVNNTPDAGRDIRLASAIISSMRISISPTENDALLMAAMEFIGKTYERDVTAGGTVTDPSLSDVFRFRDLTAVKIGSTDLIGDFYGAEINISNGAKFIADNPGGEPVFPTFEVEAEFKFLYSATVEAVMDQMRNDTPQGPAIGETVSIQFGTNPVVDGGDLEINVFGHPLDYEEDFSEGEIVTLRYKGVFGDVASDEFPCQIIFGTGTA